MFHSVKKIQRHWTFWVHKASYQCLFPILEEIIFDLLKSIKSIKSSHGLQLKPKTKLDRSIQAEITFSHGKIITVFLNTEYILLFAIIYHSLRV